MKRFVIVLALIAAAGVTYVATAPGSQTAGPTAAQLKALKKQVAKLQRDVTKVKNLANAEAILLTDCMSTAVVIAAFGDNSDGSAVGYSYTDPAVNSGTPFLRTALDYTVPQDPHGIWLPAGTGACGSAHTLVVRKIGRLAGIHVHTTTRLGLPAATRP